MEMKTNGRNTEEFFGITPSWQKLIPVFMVWLEKGTDEQKKEAKSQLNHMATICDLLVDQTLGKGKEQKNKVVQTIKMMAKN